MSTILANALWTTLAIQMILAAIGVLTILFLGDALKRFLAILKDDKLRLQLKKNASHNAMELFEDELNLASFILEQQLKKMKGTRGNVTKKLIRLTKIYNLISKMVSDLVVSEDQGVSTRKALTMTILSHKVGRRPVKSIYERIEKLSLYTYRLGFLGVVFSLGVTAYGAIHGSPETVAMRLNDAYIFSSLFLSACMAIGWVTTVLNANVDLRVKILNVTKELSQMRTIRLKALKRGIKKVENLDKELSSVGSQKPKLNLKQRQTQKKVEEDKPKEKDPLDFLPPIPME